MKKFVFWSILHKHTNIALTEDLSKYAQGETFWKAMQNLVETLRDWTPSSVTEENDINSRLKMYYETGINKVEILIEKENDKYAVACSNTRSFIKANSEQEALMKYVEAKAQSSKINTGDFT
jgi:predicted RNase H-like HicB family nuclease